MSFVVISCFDNVATGNLQADGDAVAVIAADAAARKHFAVRCAALGDAAREMLAIDTNAELVAWVVVLQMPIDVANVEEALEDLETILDEDGEADEPFEGLVVDYWGKRYGSTGSVDHAQTHAMDALRAWLT